jgi:hypothetical protein
LLYLGPLLAVELCYKKCVKMVLVLDTSVCGELPVGNPQ